MLFVTPALQAFSRQTKRHTRVCPAQRVSTAPTPAPRSANFVVQGSSAMRKIRVDARSALEEHFHSTEAPPSAMLVVTSLSTPSTLKLDKLMLTAPIIAPEHMPERTVLSA